jgi:predicted Zn-dependent protease
MKTGMSENTKRKQATTTESLPCTVLDAPVVQASSSTGGTAQAALPACTLSCSRRRHTTADYDLNIWSLQYYLEQAPDDCYSRRELARCYMQHKAHRQAAQEYRKVLVLEPCCYPTRAELADCYMAQGMWREAAQELCFLGWVSEHIGAVWSSSFSAEHQPDGDENRMQEDERFHT